MCIRRAILCVCVFSLCAGTVFAENGLEILQKAAIEGKYSYIFFYKDDSNSSLRLQKIFDLSVEALGDRVRSASINLTDPLEIGIVAKLDLKRAPMPLALVIAPNGAVMGGFPGTFTQEQLVGTLSSMGAAMCLKALQDRKLVFLCLQNSHTTDNEAASRGVKAFMTDSRFSAASELVMIDPSDANEQPFLEQLGVNSQSSKAVTVMIVPPAQIVGQYQGVTSKERMVSDLTNASSGCCCPGGCCPGGCCSPQR